MTLSAITSV